MILLLLKFPETSINKKSVENFKNDGNPTDLTIAPHLLFPQFLDDDNSKERELGLFFGNALMSKCSEVWVFGGVISVGMEAEIKRAKWKNYRLRYFNESCEEVPHV